MAPRKTKKQAQVSDKQRSLVTHFNQKSPVAEQYRTLRTNIQYASVDKEVRTIMLTSSGPGEGKSTTVANLGIALAQQGNRVLIVDSDLRKPTNHFTFQLPNQIGITNVLTKQTTFEASVYDTSIPNLFVLPSGPLPPNPSELLGSKSMKDLINLMSKMYDYVLFDAPPVNAVTDPQILSKLCDGVILVVRSGKTEEEAGKKAIESLRKVDAHILGGVLNDRNTKGNHYYYYYAEK
ncbi:CpsD/CapB family tyrosine-protein kinase [Evansella tamaricis]|uniref:non-specific protein-tyrosine kinase n=1 Tax=Evansella tamaricis TaxID=2069301 RepID=A0ABS6JMF3_9BACI|nr:CpsD/CapB family tyrosine-protein kinase [Evansella tamaricis]MBU9713498.1 CpsD/CapB family tyrosine-protein kinase [Evansella tamaricis]